MELFNKKQENEEQKISSDLALEIIKDVQAHLHINHKQEVPKMPLFISVSKIPNPEIFKTSLLDEVNEVDASDLEAQEKTKKEEAKEKQALEAIAKAKAMAEQLQKEEEAKAAKEAAEKEKTEKIARGETIEEENKIEEPKPQRELTEEELLAQKMAEDSSLIAQASHSEMLAQQDAESLLDEEKEKKERIENGVLIQTIEDIKSTREEASEDNSFEELDDDVEIEQEEHPTTSDTVEPVNDVAELETSQNIEEQTLEVQDKQEKQEPKKQIEPNIKSTPTISVISAANIKLKNRKIAKASDIKSGGVAAAKEIADVEKAKEEEQKRKEALARAAAQREAEKQAELERLKDVILIGATKKPNPELGKFEIQWSNNSEKPYKFILKNNVGKVLYESTPIRTKPNELTAVMFKDICQEGSFVFITVSIGYAFKMLDARKRVFYISKAYRQPVDAQKMAASIKKFGLSANYIDDLTK